MDENHVKPAKRIKVWHRARNQAMAARARSPRRVHARSLRDFRPGRRKREATLGTLFFCRSGGPEGTIAKEGNLPKRVTFLKRQRMHGKAEGVGFAEYGKQI